MFPRLFLRSAMPSLNHNPTLTNHHIIGCRAASEVGSEPDMHDAADRTNGSSNRLTRHSMELALPTA